MRVRYTLTASRQIEAALAYLAAESLQAAWSPRERIETTVALLQAYPHAGRITSKRSIRRIPLKSFPYLIDCRPGDDEIVVRRFRRAARRPVP